MKLLSKNAMFRWSLITGISVALFWAIWQYIYGTVPSTNEIMLLACNGQSAAIPLPFSISRWWDIMASIAFVNIIIVLINREIHQKNRYPHERRFRSISFYFCFLVGLGAFYATGGLMFSLIAFILSDIASALDESKNFVNDYRGWVIKQSLTMGLLGWTLGIGLIYGFGVSVIFFVAIFLMAIIAIFAIAGLFLSVFGIYSLIELILHPITNWANKD